jgi:hypothetical protein
VWLSDWVVVWWSVVDGLIFTKSVTSNVTGVTTVTLGVDDDVFVVDGLSTQPK